MTDVLLTLHVLSAAAWIGGGLHASLAYRRLLSTSDVDTVMDLDERLDSRYFPISVVLVLLTGIGLVLTSDVWGWTTAFVIVGLVAIALSGALEQGVIGPRTKRAAETGDIDTIQRLGVIGLVLHMGLMAVVVWAMVTRFTL